MRIERRQAGPEDKAFLKSLHHKAYKDLVIRQFGQWDEEDQDRRFDESLEGKQYQLVEIEGELVGAINLEDESDYLFLAEIQILPSWQGKGIGTQLINDIVSGTEKPVKLQVLKENKARNLYRRLGFQDSGTTDIHYLMEYSKG